jgi:hypothetical protein
MLDRNPFFRFVWRLNALVLFGAASIALVLGAYALYQIVKQETQTSFVEDQARLDPEPVTQEKLSLGRLEPVPGRDLARADVRAEQAGYGGPASSDKIIGSTRNVLLLDLETGKTRKLFDTDRNIVMAETRFPVDMRGGPTDAPTTGYIFTVVSADSDKDNRLSASDAKSLLGWPIDAEKPVVVANGIDEVLMTQMRGSVISMVVRTGKRIARLDIDPVTFQLQTTTEMIGLPSL